jgi:hypothetical protein
MNGQPAIFSSDQRLGLNHKPAMTKNGNPIGLNAKGFSFQEI